MSILKITEEYQSVAPLPKDGDALAIGLSGQNERRRGYLKRIRKEHRHYFTEAGEWQATQRPADNREWLWDLFAWLDGDAQDWDFANKLILHAPALRSEGGSGYGQRTDRLYNVFSSTHAVHLLTTSQEKLSLPAIQRLEQWALCTVEDDPGGARADLQFHGYNDNMPAKATLGLILGGEYFGRKKAVEHGLWNLHQLRLLLARRGVLSEYCSPTYSPLTLTNLAEIAQCAQNGEARELAAHCCERIWAELLAHYHPSLRSVAGPYSRAYSNGQVGHLSNLHYLLWQVLGSGLVADPSGALFEGTPQTLIHHHGDLFFVQAGFAFIAGCEHRLSDNLQAWLRQRRYPFEFSATTERGEGRPWAGFDAGQIRMKLHQHEDYSLGTSTEDWAQQCENWHLVYRSIPRKEALQRPPRMTDVRHLSIRYLVDDELPGKIMRSPRGDQQGENSSLANYANFHTLQCGSIAMVAARPLADLVGRPLERMGLGVIIPEHFGKVESLHFADGHFWLRDAEFMLAVRPMARRLWHPVECSIIDCGVYRILYLPNYAGARRTFSSNELNLTTNAFVSIAASCADMTPDHFRHQVLAAQALSYTWINQTTVCWNGFGMRLEMSYGLYSGHIRHALVNGRELLATPWEADGLPYEKLPFVQKTVKQNPYPFPYGESGSSWDGVSSIRYT